jgi:hypothetical protein
MSKLDSIVVFIILFWASCSEPDYRIEKKMLEISQNHIGKIQYLSIYKQINDSLQVWKINKLDHYHDTLLRVKRIDSLLCFNLAMNRFVSAELHFDVGYLNNDGMLYFLGEKIDGNWFFWTGAFIPIPRDIVKGHDVKKPLSYKQMHTIALDQIYGGYLTKDGKINEKWFEYLFEAESGADFNRQTEDEDWYLGGHRFKDKYKFYNFIHLQTVKSLWDTRDTTKPKIELQKDVL